MSLSGQLRQALAKRNAGLDALADLRTRHDAIDETELINSVEDAETHLENCAAEGEGTEEAASALAAARHAADIGLATRAGLARRIDAAKLSLTTAQRELDIATRRIAQRLVRVQDEMTLSLLREALASHAKALRLRETYQGSTTGTEATLDGRIPDEARRAGVELRTWELSVGDGAVGQPLTHEHLIDLAGEEPEPCSAQEAQAS